MTLTPDALERATKDRETAESEIARITEDCDPIDMFTAIAVIADYWGITVENAIMNEGLIRELMAASQSNYEKSWDAITTAAQISDRMDAKEGN